MRSKSCDFNPKKIVIISKYHSPGVYFEKVDRDPSKHGAIVEIDSEKFVPLVVQARIDVDPVFGKILWNQISLSNRFCTGLSSWLFHQWFTKNECQGEIVVLISHPSSLSFITGQSSSSIIIGVLHSIYYSILSHYKRVRNGKCAGNLFHFAFSHWYSCGICINLPLIVEKTN